MRNSANRRRKTGRFPGNTGEEGRPKNGGRRSTSMRGRVSARFWGDTSTETKSVNDQDTSVDDSQHPRNPYIDIRIRILKYFAIGTICVGYGMTILALITRGDYLLFSVSVGAIATLALGLVFAGHIEPATQLLIIGLTVLIGYRAAVIRSTLNASLLILVLLLAALQTKRWFTFGLFIVQFAYILICASIGIFSWSQTIDPETGLYLANTVTVLVPSLIIVYLISYILSKVIIESAEKEMVQSSLLRKAHERLIVQERLSSVRILAGGIAHDFNNILVALLGNLELLRETRDWNASDHDQLVTEARGAAIRARDLTRQLMMLSAENPPSTSIQTVADIIHETTGIALRGSRCRSIFELDADLWPIEADRTQISQVIQNLVLNARDAMPRGGNIVISARNHTVPDSVGSVLSRGPYIVLSVSDEGVGLAEDDMKRIFDPFYTTKSAGTGLGLSICYSVINNHKGMIDVESELGRGTRFDVYLPAKPGAVAAGVHSDAPARKPTYSGKVLIFDDDESVRMILTRMLERLGFRVDTFDDGSHVVKAYESAYNNGDSYAFTIMDLTVPGGMGGEEALGRIKLIDPQVRAVASSGYSSTLAEGNLKSKGFIDVLTKPYTLKELEAVVGRITNSGNESGR